MKYLRQWWAILAFEAIGVGICPAMANGPLRIHNSPSLVEMARRLKNQPKGLLEYLASERAALDYYLPILQASLDRRWSKGAFRPGYNISKDYHLENLEKSLEEVGEGYTDLLWSRLNFLQGRLTSQQLA